MKVAVNLTWLTPGRVGGSEEYLTRQLAGLDPDEFDLELLCDPAFPTAHPVLAERFRTNTMPIGSRHRGSRIALERSWLPVQTRHADIVHHGGGTVPVDGPRPVVLTIHDLQYRAFPKYFTATRRQYLRTMMPRSVRRAAVIAVPSDFVKRDVVEAFDVPADRVMVVPHGVPDLARPAEAEIDGARERVGVGARPYVVYPAMTHPHKGHPMLVRMLEHLHDETVVVLIGRPGAVERQLAEIIADSPQRDRVIRAGRVPDADRDALVAGADALVFPSRFEGFGAPLVEAMALGTPVVCGTAEAVVEVAGNAAIVVEDPTPEAWAAAVELARDRRDDLVARGLSRRLDFTIGVSGRALAAVYHQAVDS